MAKEATRIDQQKKQFQRTGLDTVEVMNDKQRLKTEKCAGYIFTDTILKPCGLKISRVTPFTKEVNIGNLAPAVASKASSHCAKFCCVVAALFVLL